MSAAPRRTLAGALALCFALPGDASAAQAPSGPAGPTGPASPATAAPAPATQEADEVGSGSADGDPDGNLPVIARAGLEVDTTAAGPSGPVMLSRIEELGNLELRRAEILPRRAAEDPVIRVRVEQRGSEGDTYAIFSELAVSGETLAGSTHEIVCSLCTEGEAVERARGELLRLVPFVRARFRAARKPVEPPSEPAKPPPPPDRSLTATGKAGVGLLAGGVVVLGVGAALAIRAPRSDPDMPLNQTTTRPAGYALLGVGAAALITGAVLLVLDRRKVNRRVAHLAPLLHPGSAGLQLVGRF